MSDGPHYQVLAEYRVQAGELDRVLALLGELAEASRREPGNLGYRVYQEVGEPHRILISERYVDAAAFQAHRDSDHFQRLAVNDIIGRLEERVVSAYQG